MRLGPVAEALLALAVTLPLVLWLGWPTLWFVVPFAILTVANRPYDEYGLTWRNPGSVRFHLATCALIFPAYALLHVGFARLVLGQQFDPALPPRFAELALHQFITIGLSEEFFFRGYLQTQLNRRFARRFQFAGARFGWGLLLAALLFGLCHIVTGDFARMRTAVFGLFAGWLRERTDSIAVPAAYHGFANVLVAVLSSSLH
jgi:membrane protease YdiL (CAAX protease family)